MHCVIIVHTRGRAVRILVYLDFLCINTLCNEALTLNILMPVYYSIVFVIVCMMGQSLMSWTPCAGRQASRLSKTRRRTNGAQKATLTATAGSARLGWPGQPFRALCMQSETADPAHPLPPHTRPQTPLPAWVAPAGPARMVCFSSKPPPSKVSGSPLPPLGLSVRRLCPHPLGLQPGP